VRRASGVDRPGARVAIGVAVAVVLLVLVTAGTSAFRASSAARQLTDLSAVAQVAVFASAAVAGLAVALVVVGLAAGGLGDHEFDATERKRARRRAIVLGLLVFVLVTVVAPQLFPYRRPGDGSSLLGNLRPGEQGREQPGGSGVDAWVVGIGFVLGLLAAAGITVSVRRRPRRVTTPPSATALPDAVAASIEDVLAEPDPRRAVVAAYVTMESTLRERGIPRESWETPFEFLDRVFAQVGDHGSARHLTELYELARFGHHPIGEDLRAEALHDLTTLRDELGCPV
jgi:MFS family permease